MLRVLIGVKADFKRPTDQSFCDSLSIFLLDSDVRFAPREDPLSLQLLQAPVKFRYVRMCFECSQILASAAAKDIFSEILSAFLIECLTVFSGVLHRGELDTLTSAGEFNLT